jgi:hypothetical protein
MRIRLQSLLVIFTSVVVATVIFQNCSYLPDGLKAGSRSRQSQNASLISPTKDTPKVSPAVLLANYQRTPLGQRYSDGSFTLQAGAEAFTWSAIRGFQPVSAKAGSYTQGSTHLTTSLKDGTMLAIDMRSNVSGHTIVFNGASNKWEGRFLKYSSPLGAQVSEEVFTIDILPGSSTEYYEPFSIFQTKNYTYISLYRIKYEDEKWQKNGSTGTVRAQVADSWLVRSLNTKPNEFQLMGAIATTEDYRNALAESGLKKFELPLVYAAGPRCIGLGDEEIVCALRGSADDDDGNRPLDPQLVFESPTNIVPSGVQYFLGSKIAHGVYYPEVQSSLFYIPKDNVRIPPLLIVSSKDGGKSWSRRFIAPQGGIDAHFAYDKTTDTLVLAYGGWTYPRKGIVIQWSKDRGDTWSDPFVISEESDHYTTGTLFIANTASNVFQIVYDSLDRYLEFDYHSSRPTHDLSGYRIVYRTLSVPDSQR